MAEVTGLLGSPGLLATGGLNAQYLSRVIEAVVRAERGPLQLLKLQLDELSLQQTAFRDLDGLLEGARKVTRSFLAGPDNVFRLRQVLSSEPSVAVAQARPGAQLGRYDLEVLSLALAHRVASDRQFAVDQALGLQGTFILGGRLAGTRSATTENIVPETVLAFGTSSPSGGQPELATGTYYVEVRNKAGKGDWEFRLVDSAGLDVATYDATLDDGTFTAGWQDIDDVVQKFGGTLDTRRGLTITFGLDPLLYLEAKVGGGGPGVVEAARVRYTAEQSPQDGATITVVATDSLLDIQEKINSATFPDGDPVAAAILDGVLLLEAVETGSGNYVLAYDVTGSVLQQLGVLNADGTFKSVLQLPADARMTVNGLEIVRSRNTGLDDVIPSLILDLKGIGLTRLEVRLDRPAIRSRIDDFLAEINALVAYIKDKTAVTGDARTQVYGRGPLAEDTTIYGLRGALYAALIRPVDGRPPDAPARLLDLGISLDEELAFRLADGELLEAELSRRHEDVQSLMEELAGRILARLEPFTGVGSGILDTRQAGVADRVQALNRWIELIEGRSARLEGFLIGQYGRLLDPRLRQQEAVTLLGPGTFDVYG